MKNISFYCEIIINIMEIKLKYYSPETFSEIQSKYSDTLVNTPGELLHGREPQDRAPATTQSPSPVRSQLNGDPESICRRINCT